MTKARVLVSDKLSEAGLALLRAATDVELDYKPGLKEAELAEAIATADALIIRSGSKVTAKVLDRADRLRVVGRAGIGVDNVDVPAASKRGVIVMNTPFGNTVTTAEHALSLLMSLARKIPQATASMKAGKWEKSKFEGRELWEKTLGVVGFGNIGRIVADRARGLRMTVICADPVLTPRKAEELGVELVFFEDLLARADLITIHAPLTSETRGLFDDATFAKTKKGVLLVNAARGGIVDEGALLRALESGHVGGAALDVFETEPVSPEHPLLKRDDVIVTPHLGASTEEAQERVATQVIEQVLAYLREGTVTNAVNMPSLAGDAAKRIEPYTRMAEKLGVLLAQLSPGAKELRVTAAGELGQLGVKPVCLGALSGYLKQTKGEPVSTMSAPYMAKELGLTLVEVTEADDARGWASALRVTASGGDDQHTVTGTVTATGEARLVGLDGYELDAVMAGEIVLIQNDDKPGVIGSVGTLLGSLQINVSRMQVGLDPAAHEALALWNVDTTVPPDALEALRRLPHVRAVRALKL